MTRPSHSETRFVRPIPEEKLLRAILEAGYPHPDEGIRHMPLSLAIILVGFSIISVVMYTALALAIFS